MATIIRKEWPLESQSSKKYTTIHAVRDGLDDYENRQKVIKINQPTQTTAFCGLPNELIVRVFEFLDARSIVRVAQVCLAWRSLLHYEKLWNVEAFGSFVSTFGQVSPLERHAIFSTLYVGTLLPVTSAKIVCYKAMATLVREEYHHLSPYIERISEAVQRALCSENDALVLLGIEVFGSLCDAESDMLADNEECAGYVPQLLPKMIPSLLHWIVKLEESKAEEEENEDSAPAACAQSCLTLMTSSVRDTIVPYITPFVSTMCTSLDWKQRAASCAVLGAVMEGPSHWSLKPLIDRQLPYILQSLTFPHDTVQDSAAWGLGMILEHHLCVAWPNIQTIISSLMDRIENASPKALNNVARAFEIPEYKDTIMALFQPNLERLLAVDQREDAWKCRLNIIAYETLGQISHHYAWQKACLLPVIAERLADSLRKCKTADEELRENCLEIQSSLCVMIQKYAMSLNAPRVRPVADKLLNSLLAVLDSGDIDITSRDAMMAVGSLAYNLGSDFYPYMDRFHPYIMEALQRFSSSDPSVEVWDEISSIITDCCFALGTEMRNYAGPIMTVAIQGLQNQGIRTYDRIVLCEIFGNIAMAIGGSFVDSLSTVLTALRDFYEHLSSEVHEYQEMHFSKEYEDKYFVSYVAIVLTVTQESFFSVISATVRGLRSANQSHLIITHVPVILHVLKGFATKLDSRSDTTLSNALSAANAIMSSTRQTLGFEDPFFSYIIDRSLERSSPGVVDAALCSRNLLTTLNNTPVVILE